MLTPSNTVASQERTLLEAQREHNRVGTIPAVFILYSTLSLCPSLLLLPHALQPRSVPETRKRFSRLLSRESRKRRRLAELGVDYEFPGYRGISEAMATTKKPTHITFTEEEEEDSENEVIGEAESE